VAHCAALAHLNSDAACQRLPFAGQADSGRWIAALDELLTFGTTVLVPGHGALSTTARQDMQLACDYLLYLRSVMAKAARNLEPFEQAYNTYLLLERELE
jgi:glyoxylase-like metal-dependent hydrolase (beta-lactamase superfamily II)